MLRRGVGLTRRQVGQMLAPAYRSGQYVGLPSAGSYATPNAMTADRMYAWPIPISYDTSLAGVAVQVGTAVAGVSGKLGLAYPGDDGWPAALIAECPTPVDMGLSANTELLALFASAAPVRAGIVWGLVVFDGAAQPISCAAFGTSAILLSHLIGPVGMVSYTLQGSPSGRIRLSRTHTYSDAFPLQLTGWGSGSGVPSSPVMVGKIA